MIRFCCGHCAHRISVQDNKVGKRGKCPRCGSLVVVPEKSTVVDFHCESCGHRISVPQIHAGEKAKCPKCENVVVVPEVQAVDSVTERTNSADEETSPKSAANLLTLLDVPQEYKIQDQPTSQAGVSGKAIEQEQESEEEWAAEETEPVGQRKLPWLIDIFLYPISMPGLISLGIFIGIPLVIHIVGLLLGPFALALALPSLIIRILIGLYMGWYFAECVRDSAAGGIRAPEAFSTTDIGDMFHQALNLVGCYLVFAGPAFFYSLYAKRTDTIYWSLLAYGVFFFPIGLLGVVMFGSLHGLNPIILIGSVFSTFFPYCGLVLIFGVVVLIAKTAPKTQSGSWATFVSAFVALYLVLVILHLLGRFYWRYHEKLNWEV